MKKLLFSVLLAASLVLTGCFETTQEITLNDDGTGSLSTTNDLSQLISFAKQMGGGDEMNKAGDQKMDSTFALASIADSIPGLTDAEKSMAAKGNARIVMNLKDDKFLTVTNFPFASPKDIPSLNQLTAKVMSATMKDKMGDAPGGAVPEMPAQSSMEDYYKIEFAKGELSRKLDKDKYDNVSKDEYLVSMKETAAMGLGMKSTLIINLPRPASKAEGKNVTLSADKKKVTIRAGLEDFFEDPTALEFKIKY